jgi:voltage-dependent potassium channel beta subunit
MEYRRLGRSGLKVSEIALGSWLTLGGYVERSSALDTMKAALDEGVNFFDTADVYSGGEAERLLGEFLGDVRRQDVVVATKCFFPTGDGPNDRGLSRKHVVESLEKSLRLLGVEYVDLYQCHRYDPDTPMEELVETMTNLVRQGRILYWGVSNWSAAQIVSACSAARALRGVRPVSNQPPYSLLERAIEDEILPVCGREGLGQIVYSPLAQGVLTGKYSGGRVPDGSRAARKGAAGQFIRRFLRPDTLAAVDRCRKVAEEAGMSPVQLALAWCLRRGGVSSVIVGASSAAQLRESVRASGLGLSPVVLEEIEEALRNPEE